MNRLLTTTAPPAALSIAICMALFACVPPSWAGAPPVTATPGVSEPPAGAAVFEMKYRGLTGPDDPLSYSSYWGFGASDDNTAEKDSFVRAVRARAKEYTPVYYRSPAKAQWSVVELKDKKPVALYFDLNTDGKLSDDEKFLPLVRTESKSGYPFVCVTSDFLIRTDDRREIPFRVMLVGQNNGPEIAYMWSPACVLEGQANLAGQQMRLVLYSNGFGGSFTEFGRDSIMLIPAEQKLEGYIPHYMRGILSSLMNYQGTFYRLKLQGAHTKDGAIRAMMEKDTTPTGQAIIELAGKEGLKTRLSTLGLQGAKDASIQLYMANTRPTLPVGQYKVSYGDVGYGLQSDAEWRANIRDGSSFDIKAADTTQVSLGQPVLSIKAIEEKDRGVENAKERATYAKGTEIYLAPQIKGKAGEVYTPFAQKNAGTDNYTNVKPHVTIRDPGGKTVVSTDMEYG